MFFIRTNIHLLTQSVVQRMTCSAFQNSTTQNHAKKSFLQETITVAYHFHSFNQHIFVTSEIQINFIRMYLPENKTTHCPEYTK